MRLLQAIVYGLETHSANSSIEEESSIQMTKSFHLSNSAVQEIFTTHLCIVVKHSPNTVFFNAMNLLLNGNNITLFFISSLVLHLNNLFVI